MLAHLAEVEERRLYLPAPHPSMYSYCVHVLGLSEDAAFKRIRAARAAREFPAIFTAVADGRLHLSTVLLLKPHLTADTADDLLMAAARKTRSEVEQLLAQRFPQPEVPTRIEPLSPSLSPPLLTDSPALGSPEQQAPGPVAVPRPLVTPLAPERFSLQLTMGQAMHDKLRYAQTLLSHQLPSGDVVEVLDRALDALIVKLEGTQFARTDRPRAGRQRASASPRYVPAHVKRAVRERDGNRCTFVSATGERCPARALLEIDHIDEVARGGEATTQNLRVRCRSHNQYEAERTFGTEFIQHKRGQARRAAAERRGAAARAAADRAASEHAAAAKQAAEEGAAAAMRAAEEGAAAAMRAAAERAAAERAAAERAAAQATELDLVHCLRQLGFRAEQARLAIRQCENIPDVPIEERLRTALKFLGSRGRTYGLRQVARNPGTAAGFVAP